MKKYLSILLLSALVACAPSTGYQNVNKNTLSITFSATDQKMLVEELANKLVNDSALRGDISGRPTLLIDTIKNKTSEQIDTESMTDTLKTSIIKARLFSIISRDKTNLLLKEQEINQSGLTDQQKATQLGKLWGAKFVMYGNFSSIVNYVKSEKQVYYKFTLIVQNLETGEEIWIDEAEINKVRK
jgi:uncharacterized protein (TIGR02722 family)